jgi:hypothetical protein
MELLFNSLLLAAEDPNGGFPWAGFGAALLGLGSTFSGIAAIITARNKGANEAHNPDDSRIDDGGGSGISGGGANSGSSG